MCVGLAFIPHYSYFRNSMASHLPDVTFIIAILSLNVTPQPRVILNVIVGCPRALWAPRQHLTCLEKHKCRTHIVFDLI